MKQKLHKLLESGTLSFYTFIICLGLLAVQIHWLPPFMVALVILRWLERKRDIFSAGPENQRSRYLFFLFTILFLWQVSGLILADSLLPGLERIIKRAAFVLFPAALFYPSEKIRENLFLALKIFVVCILAYILFCFCRALDNSLVRENGKLIFRPYHPVNTWESWFTGFHLSGKIHPSYLAMYVQLSVLLSLEFFFEGLMKNMRQFFWLITALALFAVELLLSSRAGIISAAITIPLFLFFRLRSRFPSRYFIMATLIFIAAFLVLIASNSRIRYTIEDISSERINQTMANDIRLNIWRSAIGVIKVHPVFGVGTGNASMELKKEFVAMGYKEGFYETLNAHNQFLEILLENGFVGLMIFLGILTYMAYTSIAEKNYIFMTFILMMFIFFLFESMLNRLAGVTFFSLFTFVLIQRRESFSK